jgi:hypothetical protein
MAGMRGIILWALAAFLVVVGVIRTLRSRRARAVAASANPSPAADGQLVAVIAAAVAAASGMKPGEFRIAGVSPAEGASSSGFNTPIWGHVDRLYRRAWQR